MRRGAKPAKARVEAKLPIARRSRTSPRDLEQRLAEALGQLETRTRELADAREQQGATSEILRVISSSPTDLMPVAQAIADSAARLCDCAYTAVFRFDGELIHWVAARGTSTAQEEALRAIWPRPANRETLAGRTILAGEILRIEDAAADPTYTVLAGRTVLAIRSVLNVPMLREGRPVGVIGLIRSEVRPFSAQEVSLVQTFADQAVIAIESVRLFNELQGSNRNLSVALERETATSEILKVISRSTTDVQPVFDGIVRSAVRLCRGLFGSLVRFDGEFLHLIAHHNFSPEALEEHERLFPRPLGPEHISGRAVLTHSIVHIPDITSAADLPVAHALRRGLEFRAIIGVPMLLDDKAIGAIVVARAEPEPFSKTEIELLKTFADQSVIAIENVRLFTELQEKNRALTQAHAQVTEALEQQTATAEILRIISTSPTDLRPVLEAVVESAVRFCGAHDAVLFRLDGQVLRGTAHHGPIPSPINYLIPVVRGTVSGRSVLERRAIHVVDLQAAGEEFPEGSAQARELGFRAVLVVPLLSERTVIGTIGLRRTEANPFTDRQVALLQTFADQAVIAIENVRLFKELEARNRDLTATGEILQVISRSPTDAQPVFDTIARSAVRLCGGGICGVFRVEAERVGIAAIHGLARHHVEAVQRLFPIPLGADSLAARAIREGRVLQVPDTEAPDTPSITRESGRVAGFRNQLTVPMLHDGRPIGSINVMRPDPGPFSDNQISLLQTFADQAVIAIENVRLFKELEARNRDLTDALDRQTATADILRVISQAQADVQPVFDTIVDSAVRLCRARFAVLLRITGRRLELAAHSKNVTAEWVDMARQRYPVPLSETAVAGVAILERRAIHVPDLEQETRFAFAQELARTMDYRSIVFVPMLREDTPIGAIGVAGNEPFTDGEIELLKTFADQAVIAIENVRLFAELKARTQDLTRSVEQLTALGDVGRTLSSTLDLDTVLQTIVTRASQLAGTDACSVFEYDEATEAFHLRATHNLDEEVVALARRTPIRKGEGVQGRMAVTRQPAQVPDIAAEDAYHGPLRDILLRTGTRALLAIPMVREDQLIGGFTVAKKTAGDFPPEVIDLLKTFATQSALAIQNARLFREIADKSRQLEVASQHKSEFLANMSHELRTPLNAIIGFSEVLAEGMFGEVNEKQTEYLRDILESGQHLLSLINDILDLSKIEAGRMELELTDFDLPQAISNALTLVRERAGRRGIALHQALDQRLGQIRGDERKIKQVLLNLLSNALKFTPEGGRVDVRAGIVDGLAEISVADTGVGIAPEDQEAVFEEFRQVGTAAKKVEGTGLGLALSRKFIELHGGKIWVKSQVGMGSTFTFTLPLTSAQRRQAG